MSTLVAQQLTLLASVRVRVVRLALSTPGVRTTVPQLRGVWGASLREVSPSHYAAIFEGDGPEHDRRSRYALRPATADFGEPPAIDWTCFNLAPDDAPVLRLAWERACERGLGPRRKPFTIRRAIALGPPSAAAEVEAGLSWPLSGIAGDQGLTSRQCALTLRASTSLRLISGERLLEKPSLSDIVLAIATRVARLGAAWSLLDPLRKALVCAAGRVPCSEWVGQRQDVVRYSGRQRREVELRGAVGELVLPEGAGELWPLLCAAPWVQLGKGTTLGMGVMHLVGFGAPIVIARDLA